MIIFNINDFILLNDEFNILSNIVLQADPELTLEFFENILKGLSVEHDATTGTNKLYLHL